jgi:hypothetical protein
LILVATDAAAAAALGPVRQAVAEGRAVAWGTKAVLGEVLGGPHRPEIAVAAITSAELGAALAETVRTAHAAHVPARGELPRNPRGENGPQQMSVGPSAVPRSESPELSTVSERGA